jgi:hypothetical protein
MAVPFSAQSARPHNQDQASPEPAGTTTVPRVSPDGRDTLVEMMQHIQERLFHIEGHLMGEGRQGQRLRRTNTSRNGEDPFESRSDGTSDIPPTYKE